MLPTSALTCTFYGNTGGAATTPMPYAVISGIPTWDTGNYTVPGGLPLFEFQRVQISCTPGVCTNFYVTVYVDGTYSTVSGDRWYSSPPGCNSYAGTVLLLGSYSCSPLSIPLLTNTSGPPIASWTFTP